MRKFWVKIDGQVQGPYEEEILPLVPHVTEKTLVSPDEPGHENIWVPLEKIGKKTLVSPKVPEPKKEPRVAPEVVARIHQMHVREAWIIGSVTVLICAIAGVQLWLNRASSKSEKIISDSVAKETILLKTSTETVSQNIPVVSSAAVTAPLLKKPVVAVKKMIVKPPKKVVKTAPPASKSTPLKKKVEKPIEKNTLSRETKKIVDEQKTREKETEKNKKGLFNW